MAAPQIHELPSAEGLTEAPASSPMAKVWRAMWGNKTAFVGLVVLSVLVILSIFAPLIAPYPINQQVGQPFSPPSAHHLLGLDDAGYDVFSLLLYGMRISLLVGFSATVIASVLGTLIGVDSAVSARRPSTVRRQASRPSFMLSSTNIASCAGASGWCAVLAWKPVT